MRYVLVSVLVAMLLLPAVAPATFAQGYRVNFTIIGADGEPLANAKVTLYSADGDVEDEGTTDENGTVTLMVSELGPYLVVVKSEYYIIDAINVTTDNMNVTIDASALHYANLTSTPRSVEVTVRHLEFTELQNIGIKMSTNVTVYATDTINVTFPKEVVEVPYKYVLDYIKYDTKETNETTITLDMTENYEVTAYYIKTFYLTMEYWVVIILVIIAIIALAVAWSAGASTARAKIAEWRERNRRFVVKKQ